jgi:uncharacterized membrane protein YccC
MADQDLRQSDTEKQESAGLIQSLRKGFEPESVTGMWQHAVATAVALVVCLTLVRLLPVREGYWAAISTVVLM